MKMNPRVKTVRPETDYRLRIVFTDGAVKSFDTKPLLDKGVFKDLRDPSVFRAVRPAHGSVAWPGGQDICPDTLYENSVAVSHQPMVARERGEKYVVTRKPNRKT